MRNNYRALGAALVLAMITALTPEQGLKNTEELWEAVKRSDAASVKALLNQEVDPNSKTQEGQTIFMLVAYKGHLGIVRALIQANAEVNETNNYGGTALMGGALAGHIPCVQLLLQAGAHPKHKNNAGQTAHDLTQDIEDENIREKILLLLDEQITQ